MGSLLNYPGFSFCLQLVKKKLDGITDLNYNWKKKKTFFCVFFNALIKKGKGQKLCGLLNKPGSEFVPISNKIWAYYEREGL